MYMPRKASTPRNNVVAAGLRKAAHALASHWIVLALMIPLAMVAIAASILIWPVDQGEGPYPAKAYERYATPSTLTPLLKDDSIAGDSVFLNNVQLIPAAQDDEYFARGADGKYMLVILAGKPVDLHDRDVIADVQGVIRTLPPSKILKRDWKLKPQQLSRISGEQFYLSAQRIQIDSDKNQPSRHRT
jgi:hypothetical protein